MKILLLGIVIGGVIGALFARRNGTLVNTAVAFASNTFTRIKAKTFNKK